MGYGRRNSFWLAYAMERQQGCSNGWALSLDDNDITQMMPAKSDLFDSGVSNQDCDAVLIAWTYAP